MGNTRRVEDKVTELLNGREVPPGDLELVRTFAGLVLRVEDARHQVTMEGVIIDDGKGFPVPHPGLEIERRTSAELRGWVKDRPDLFGAPVEDTKPRREKFGGFKVV